MKRYEAIIQDGVTYLVAEPVHEFAPGASLCQHGRCGRCKKNLVSVGKDAYCPVCGRQVYLT